MTRRRHLQHVTVNMSHLTDPALMGRAPVDSVDWIAPRDLRPPVPPGLALERLNAEESHAVHEWLDRYPWDRDDQLDSRMDNQGDEVGRSRSALRTRVRLAERSKSVSVAAGSRLAFDARALQSSAFGTRGIGRFARAALLAAREALGDDRITLMVDRGLHPLPGELAGNCEQVVRVGPGSIERFGMFLQPSPMTHDPQPYVDLLLSSVTRIALVFDFIPLHLPTLYMPHVAARAEYAANLDALARYDDYICISHLVEAELAEVLGHDVSATVAWPRDVGVVEHSGAIESPRVDREQSPIVLMTGDDPRKNTFGGLAGIAAATSDQESRDVVVVGMAGQDVKVHHSSIAAAMRPGEARTLGRVSDVELDALLGEAACVVVPSFDEGLSLPVIEALRGGTPVVASDIASHRELIGAGAFMCDPASPTSICDAIRRTRGRSDVARQQLKKLESHSHEILEEVVANLVQQLPSPADEDAWLGESRDRRRLSIGVATPWQPQRTGVADYSVATLSALAEHVDLTLYVTSDARVEDTSLVPTGVRVHSIEDVLADPHRIAEEHDEFFVIAGNSHFHLTLIELLRNVDATIIAHDTRMIEYYLSLRGKGGAEQLMLMTADPQAPHSITPALADQVDDMRLLQNAGFWEIARRAKHLILHSPSAAPRIEKETGRAVSVLPFANYRAPSAHWITDHERDQAREALGLTAWPSGTIHLGSFGYVDTRTKLHDVVVEAAAWLTQWGHSVALHFVGSGSPEQVAHLSSRAERAGLAGFQVTGYVSEEDFRRWLVAVDLGIQLRISPLLGVSGPLSDLAAYGTPAVASGGLCVDVDPPAFIQPLPDAVSPVLVAEAVEAAFSDPMPPKERERLRRTYLEEKSPARYALALLGLLEAAR